MLRYATLRKKPKDLLALTGLARREFDELLPVFERVLAKALPQRRQRRQRALGGGRKPVLATAADQLLFILVYMKTYPLQAVQAHLFGMNQPSANRYIHQLLPVLAKALNRLGVMREQEDPQVARHERRQGGRCRAAPGSTEVLATIQRNPSECSARWGRSMQPYGTLVEFSTQFRICYSW